MCKTQWVHFLSRMALLLTFPIHDDCLMGLKLQQPGSTSCILRKCRYHVLSIKNIKNKTKQRLVKTSSIITRLLGARFPSYLDRKVETASALAVPGERILCLRGHSGWRERHDTTKDQRSFAKLVYAGSIPRFGSLFSSKIVNIFFSFFFSPLRLTFLFKNCEYFFVSSRRFVSSFSLK